MPEKFVMLEIAIVEDEKSYRNTLCSYLERYQEETGQQVHVSVFTDGDEIVERYSAAYDILLLFLGQPFRK